jgi:hypothetical protein
MVGRNITTHYFLLLLLSCVILVLFILFPSPPKSTHTLRWLYRACKLEGKRHCANKKRKTSVDVACAAITRLTVLHIVKIQSEAEIIRLSNLLLSRRVISVPSQFFELSLTSSAHVPYSAPHTRRMPQATVTHSQTGAAVLRAVTVLNLIT